MPESTNGAMKRLFLKSFGCQMNIYDGDLMVSAFKRRGYTRADEPEGADVVLINTCAVREHAEDKVFSALGELKRHKKKNPNMLLGVTGCMAERLGSDIAKRAPYVDIVAGARSFGEILDLAAAARHGKGAVVSIGHDSPPPAMDVSVRTDPHRAFVAVFREAATIAARSASCPRRAAARRGARRRTLVDEVRSLVADGVVEVTLLGQNIDSYGKDRPEGEDLHHLLHACHGIEGLKRLRFVTSHPADMEPVIFDDMATLPKMCGALHIPPQSGSNAVLKRMARGYTRERFLDIVHEYRRRFPEGEIAADFIIGFPGEDRRGLRADGHPARGDAPAAEFHLPLLAPSRDPEREALSRRRPAAGQGGAQHAPICRCRNASRKRSTRRWKGARSRYWSRASRRRTPTC